MTSFDNTKVIMKNRDSVVIFIDRYNELLRAEAVLSCIESNVVDNWCCYSEAMEQYNGMVDRGEIKFIKKD